MRTEFLSPYIRLLIVKLLQIYGVEFDFVDMGANFGFDFVWEEVPRIPLEDGNEIDIADFAKKYKEHHVVGGCFNACIEKDLFILIDEKTELFLEPRFCIEWLSDLAKNGAMKGSKINGPGFCDLFFYHILPKFVITHISATESNFYKMYEKYDLKILSLIKVVMKQVSHSFWLDDLPETSSTQKIYETFGRNCVGNIYTKWEKNLGSVYSSMFIQLVDGTLKRRHSRELDFRFEVLYFKSGS